MVSSILSRGILLLLFGFVNCLQVTPGSPCAAVCLDHPDDDAQNPAASSTNSSDIACLDSEYGSSPAGIKFKNCLSCLKDSKAVSGSESDVSWFLYNLRYAVDVCVFGSLNALKTISTPCDIDYGCAPLAESLKYGISNLNNASEFGYCTAGNGAFKNESVEACYQCFQASDDQVYLANFLIALQAGCEQTPAPGSLLGISGTLFSDTPIKVTAPPTDDNDNDANTSKTDDSNPTSMTTGTIVGIAVGAALLFLGGLGLFIVHRRREKRARERNALGSDYDPRGGSGSITAPSKGAFTAYDSRPSVSMISGYELNAQRAYMNDANYYDSLEKEIAARRANYSLDPRQLPTHPAYIPGNVSRGPSRAASPAPPAAVKHHVPDSYAMQQYLNAVEDIVTIPIPPPPSSHPPSRTSNRSPSPTDSATARLIRNPQPVPHPPPPPPPARHNKVPSLSMPSVPRIKIPRKYSPPVISVQGATPVDTQENQPATGNAQTSKPLTIHERRFHDRGLYITTAADIQG
ncbi:uncharacterized protein F4812DRAFT_372841 [Daldinia caldariorum]|uniref:uncharacterized protein n=1 Tax=Daldinia caldariorum TaxID=326644 RepID=UPI002007D813|nr:uncharacterized protein F4812DRAFT_372841 [Daldinia caldariorum]KAI1468556.1 hypothetical protein F4812DRAFT_372841 [Daldinia caldariorum]